MFFSDPSFTLTLNISFVAAVIASVFYLVGWIISDAKIEDVGKIAMQFEGLIFTSKYVVLPALIAYPIIQYAFPLAALYSTAIILIFLAFQIVLWIFMSYSVAAHAYLRKLGLSDYFEEQVDEYLEENNLGWLDEFMSSYKGTSVSEYLVDFSHKAMELSGWLFVLLNISLIISGFLILTKYGLYSFSIFSLWSIILLLNMALIYGFKNADYPDVEIFTSSDEFRRVQGKLIKKDEDFLYVRDDREIKRIPKENLEIVGTEILSEE